MSTCKCKGTSESVLGDGCDVCNPSMALEVAEDRIAELEAENKRLKSRGIEDMQHELAELQREREQIRDYCWKKVGTGIDDSVAIAIFNTLEHFAPLLPEEGSDD